MGVARAVHVSVGCNGVPGAADWGPNGLVAFGASNFVAVYLPGDRIVSTLRGHEGRVNCVKWITSGQGGVISENGEELLVTAATDGTVRVWALGGSSDLGGQIPWKCIQMLAAHKGPVTSLCVLSQAGNPLSNGDEICVVSTSVDGTMKFWGGSKGKSDEFLTERQVIDFKTKYALSTSLARLPNRENAEILAVGCVDSKIHLFTRQKKDENSGPVEFRKMLNLVGHKDWIPCLAFAAPVPSENAEHSSTYDLLLASGSQDSTVRLWRISPADPEETGQTQTKSPLDKDPQHQTLQIRAKRELIKMDGGVVYEARKESVLVAHDEWVYSVQWQPLPAGKDTEISQKSPRMCLLTASMDKTMMIWRPSKDHHVWVNEVCVGELGGGTFGFVGGLWGPGGSEVMAHGCQGAFQRWKHVPDVEGGGKAEEGGRGGRWVPQISVTGHFGPVEDLAWEPSGGYLLSASSDQTVRLYGRLQNYKSDRGVWHEIARPQIHGYDMQCCAFVSRLQYVSGAEEKVVRIFDAPENFVDACGALCSVDFDRREIGQRPLGASVPALGLSNKGLFLENIESERVAAEKDNFAEENPPTFTYNPNRPVNEPPLEEHLSRNTLWPETQKLYGHGYDIFTVASTHTGTYIASACKATTAEHAVIRVWDAKKWVEAYTLPGHTLTVTQLAFSPDDRYLLSVSRDRGWCMFESTNGSPYTPVAKAPKAHERILWGGAWAPDGTFFVTVSRDKTVKFWNIPHGENTAWTTNAASTVKMAESVTAVDFAPIKTKDGKYVVAIGLDNGALHVLIGSGAANGDWRDARAIHESQWHASTVRKVKWSNAIHSDGLLLATCGVDHSVRVFSVGMESLV